MGVATTVTVLDYASAQQTIGALLSPVTPASTSVAASNVVIKSSAGSLAAVDCINTLSSLAYLMLFNATTAPADGTVTPVKCYLVPAYASLRVVFNTPLAFSTGIVAVMSSTGPFTKTATATAFISGDAQ
jgi:hypothetical protein